MYSYLNCNCNIVWSSSYPSNLNRLFLLQKLIVRILFVELNILVIPHSCLTVLISLTYSTLTLFLWLVLCTFIIIASSQILLMIFSLLMNKYIRTIHGMLAVIIHITVELTLSSLWSSIKALRFGKFSLPWDLTWFPSYSSFKTFKKIPSQQHSKLNLPILCYTIFFPSTVSLEEPNFISFQLLLGFLATFVRYCDSLI